MPVPDKKPLITPTQYFAKGWDGRSCEHAGMDAQCLCSVIHSGIEAAAKEDSQDTIPCNQGSPDLIEQALTTAIINEDEFVAPEVLIEQLQ